MKFLTTLAVAATALTIGVTGAAAGPDGFQPQLREEPASDVIDRYLHNNAPAPSDAVDRYLKNHSGLSMGTGDPSSHPDSQAVRPAVFAQAEPISDAGVGFNWESSAVGALGACLLFALALVGGSAMRERRRLVLR